MELLYRRPILCEPSLPSAKSFSIADYYDSESFDSQQYDGTAERSSILSAGVVSDEISWYGCSQCSGMKLCSVAFSNVVALVLGLHCHLLQILGRQELERMEVNMASRCRTRRVHPKQHHGRQIRSPWEVSTRRHCLTLTNFTNPIKLRSP